MKNKYYIYKWPIIILVGSIIISIGISFIPDGILDVEKKITITLSLLGIGFTVSQFLIGEINTEKRRVSDLKLTVYTGIMGKCDDLITECLRLLYAEYTKPESDLGYIIIDVPTKKYLFSSSIVFYGDLLNINLLTKDYTNLNEKIIYLQHNKISSEEEYSSTSKSLVKLVSNFNMSLYKMLLK